jgi:uncharacterized protein YkwD
MKNCISSVFFMSFAFFSLAQNAWQTDLLQQVNALRQKGCRCGNKNYAATTALTWNNKLELSSNNHATEMKIKDYFSHTSRNGNGFAERIEAAGYNWGRCGENIATGQLSVNEVFTAWRKSPSHCKNMMNPEYKEMGAARSANYWVQDFGTQLAPPPKRKK